MKFEREWEIARMLARIRADKKVDLEAWETGLRTALMIAGARYLEEILDGIGSGRPEVPPACRCGAAMKSKGRRAKTLLTILGRVKFSRSMFQCPSCGQKRYPGDAALDVMGTGRSPGLRRMMARAGGRGPFKEAAEDLRIYAGVRVSPKDVERVAEAAGRDIEAWSLHERKALIEGLVPPDPEAVPISTLYVLYDGTGVPMTRSELRGRKGKQADGSARTREAKLGCVFTQTTLDEEGRPVRDPGSTTFVGAIETSEAFGWRIYAEARRRGLDRAQRVVVLGDGAPWIRTLAAQHFHAAIHIVDLYHAREHIGTLLTALWGRNSARTTRDRDSWIVLLDQGRIEKIISLANEALTGAADPDTTRKEIAYFKTNARRMRYAKFKAQGLFVGSGVVEAGCKSVIGARLKQSGMEWSLPGANAIIALACFLHSGRFDEYWETRSDATNPQS